MNRGNNQHRLGISNFIFMTIGLGISGTVFAGHFVPVSEPSILSLLAIGGALGIVIAIRNKRKK